MEKITVLIADDSVVYRSMIKAALADEQRIEIVGSASNGKIAFEKLAIEPVDLLILDLEMPELDGIGLLNLIRKNPVLAKKVLVFSSLSKRGAEITLEALRLGASDFVTKPDGSISGDPAGILRQLLIPRIQALYPEQPRSLEKVAQVPSYQNWEIFAPKVVVIGSSTGGPTMLERNFQGLQGPLGCPIFIAQHMPPIFTATLAERLEKLSGVKVAEAVDRETVENRIYIAPGDYHMRLAREGNKTVIRLDQGPQINFVRPAVDPLFETAAEIYKHQTLGVILTGMGSDGRMGASAVKKYGGFVSIQSEASCVVFGMPGAVFTDGNFDHILDPDALAKMLKEKATRISGSSEYLLTKGSL